MKRNIGIFTMDENRFIVSTLLVISMSETDYGYLRQYATSLNGHDVGDAIAALRSAILRHCAEHSGDAGEPGEKARAFMALQEINRLNHIGNDLQAYLFAMADWGLGIREDRPRPESYGVDEAE